MKSLMATLGMSKKKIKIFVANRIELIREHSEAEQ